MPPIKLYMIPGSATDYRVFAPQLEQFPGITSPHWLPPLKLKESLESYAWRLGEEIDVSRPFILGGVSLGGMIAQQMALSLQPKGLILIATCHTSKALPWTRRVMGKFTRALPDFAVRIMLLLLSQGVSLSRLKRRKTYAQMLREMPPRLVRWQSGAATEWKPKTLLTLPVFQIHGEKDPVIPVGNVRPTRVVKGGGHLINVTHESEVNAFIRESIVAILSQANVEKKQGAA